jgi:DNA helicase-2/ATP-dependent DNA helicase PcrA
MSPIEESLLTLLEVFWERIFTEYSFLSREEKTSLVKDTFENNGLKQYLEFVNNNIIISTVHAAKGLEWDFVILPDMEQDSFPNWYGLCGSCGFKKNCDIKIDKSNETKFLEELSVFYVAVTRARRQVFFTASKSAPDKYDRDRPKNISCFLSLPGINY